MWWFHGNFELGVVEFYVHLSDDGCIRLRLVRGFAVVQVCEIVAGHLMSPENRYFVIAYAWCKTIDKFYEGFFTIYDDFRTDQFHWFVFDEYFINCFI